jgi:hypothetical protein
MEYTVNPYRNPADDARGVDLRQCDWWLETRSKCSESATHLVTDRHGAPWGFCDLHYPLRYYQGFGRLGS